jgi:branched-chain amino acid transport system substrate-binding protein
MSVKFKRETMTIALSLATALGCAGAIIYTLANPATFPWVANILTQNDREMRGVLAESKMSNGDKILIRQEEGDRENHEFASLKKQGQAFFTKGNYQSAATNFNLALQKYRNAPETLIYAQNATIGKNPAYTIAVVVRSDDSPRESLKILRGAAQAQQEINSAGGINNIPLKITIVDDDNQPKVAGAMARNIANRTDALGVVGHYSSDCTLAASRIYEDKKLVSISPISTSDRLTGSSKYLFRTVPRDSVSGKKLAEYLVDRQLSKAVVIYDSSSGYSQSLKSAFVTNVKINQGEIVAEIDLNADPNYQDKLSDEIDRSQVLMLALPDTRIRDIPTIAKLNNRRIPMLGGDDLYNIKLLQSSDPNLVTDLVLSVPWSIDENANTTYVINARKLWNADIDWQSVTSYDATMALVYAIKASANPTRETVFNALNRPDFTAPGASQAIKFQNGDRLANNRLVQIQKMPKSRSGLGYDFVSVPAKLF